MPRRLVPILLSLTVLGCTAPDPADAVDDCFTCIAKADSPGPEDGSCETQGLLAFVSGADFETLDEEVRLDSRAAAGIVEHGDFSTLAELDAIPYVGPVAIRKLIEYTAAQGLVDCDKVELSEGEPNTEFGETFIALQEEATGACVPFGAAFYYSQALSPSNVAIASSVGAYFAAGDPEASWNVETTVSRSADLAPFLESFGFDLPGLHGAIGFDDYQLARVVLGSGDTNDETMVLHYRDRKEVWTVTLSCTVE